MSSSNPKNNCHGKITQIYFADKNLCFDENFKPIVESFERKLVILDNYFEPSVKIKLKVQIEQMASGPYGSYFVKEEKLIVLGVFENNWFNLSEEVFIHEATHAYLDYAQGYEYINEIPVLKESVPDLMVELILNFKENVGSCEEKYHRRYIDKLHLDDEAEKFTPQYYISRAKSCCENSIFLYGREKHFCSYLSSQPQPEPNEKAFSSQKSSFYSGLVFRDFLIEWNKKDSNAVQNFLKFYRGQKYSSQEIINFLDKSDNSQELMTKFRIKNLFSQ